jgi:SOS-response transcriptional repressor LexA
MVMRSLTNRQATVLKFICDFHAANLSMPTRAEISKHFGWRSANSAECYLRVLESRGRINVLRGTARGIRLLSTDGVLGVDHELENRRLRNENADLRAALGVLLNRLEVSELYAPSAPEKVDA